MKARIDKVVGWGEMVFAVTTIDKREVLQMGIVIQNQIVEYNDAEELQHLDGCRHRVSANQLSTFLIAQMTVLIVAASVDFGQSS